MGRISAPIHVCGIAGKLFEAVIKMTGKHGIVIFLAGKMKAYSFRIVFAILLLEVKRGFMSLVLAQQLADWSEISPYWVSESLSWSRYA